MFPPLIAFGLQVSLQRSIFLGWANGDKKDKLRLPSHHSQRHRQEGFLTGAHSVSSEGRSLGFVGEEWDHQSAQVSAESLHSIRALLVSVFPWSWHILGTSHDQQRVLLEEPCPSLPWALLEPTLNAPLQTSYYCLLQKKFVSLHFNSVPLSKQNKAKQNGFIAPTNIFIL